MVGVLIVAQIQDAQVREGLKQLAGAPKLAALAPGRMAWSRVRSAGFAPVDPDGAGSGEKFHCSMR